MEPDRFQKNHTIFILGLFSLMAALGLLALSVYITPSILLGWVYNTPAFIPKLVEILRNHYNYTVESAYNMVLLCIFLASIFFSVIAYICSNHIDNQIYSSELDSNTKPVKATTGFRGELRLILTLLFSILLIICVVQFFLWLINDAPSTSVNHQALKNTNIINIIT